MCAVTAGSSDQIQQCLDAGLLSMIIALLIADADEEVSNECSYVISNSLTGGTLAQMIRLVTQPPYLMPALNVVLKSSNPAILRVAFEALQHLMDAGDDLLSAYDPDAPNAEFLLLPPALRVHVESDINPFRDLVATHCMRHIQAACKGDVAENAAKQVRDGWWTEEEVEEACSKQSAAEEERKQAKAQMELLEMQLAADADAGAGAGAGMGAGSVVSMSEEDQATEAMEQLRIEEQKKKDQAARTDRVPLHKD